MEREEHTVTRMNSHKEDLESQVFPLWGGNEEEAVTSSFKRRFCMLLALLVLFFGLFTLITWLAIRPLHAPTYNIANIEVHTFAMSGSTLKARFIFDVVATNKNHKVGFKYDWVTIDTSYEGHDLGRGVIAGFTQGKRTTAARTTEINLNGNGTLPKEMATSITTTIQNGSIPLRAYAKAKIRAKVGNYVSFPLSVDVDCKFTVVPGWPGIVPKVVSKVCKLTRPRYKKARKFKPPNY